MTPLDVLYWGIILALTVLGVSVIGFVCVTIWVEARKAWRKG